jgi:hypothetical protein
MMVIHKTKYAEIGSKMREMPTEKHISSYEWEELVEKLCASDDASLHGIGVREKDKMKHKQHQSDLYQFLPGPPLRPP